MNEEENEKKEEKNDPLMNILGNALYTTKKHNVEDAGLETKKCKSCGAARPADTNLKYCDYCGEQFY